MLPLLLVIASLTNARAAEGPLPEGTSEHEPIRYFERYKPSFFLLGKPITKVQISFKVQILREIPLYFAYSQLMMWDLFKNSAPFRDLNYNPEIFYRLRLGGPPESTRYLDLGLFEHESNGLGGPDSRGWNRSSIRYTSTRLLPSRGVWWSVKLQLPYDMPEPESKRLPQRRGLWEAQISASDLFNMFDVNELILRVWGGGASRVNPFQGGQELTYREKDSSRIVLLPLYLQIFHGYGENLLDAEDNRWGLRAGVGF